MKDIEMAKKIAVLIDAENAQCSVLAAVLNELSKHGHIIVKCHRSLKVYHFRSNQSVPP